MIEKMVDDILDKLLITTPKDSEDFVGIEDHIAKMSELLQLESEEVRMIGIWGSSGIGKTTIARILYTRLSRLYFKSSVFIDKYDISKSMEIFSRGNPDDYNIKLHLQETLLSKILAKEGIHVDHLGVVREKLRRRKVLIVIDDLDEHVVLDALVGQANWFGSGSRIIVVTKDKHVLRAHEIDHIYEVGLPSTEQALHMFCRYAFRTDSPPDGFVEIASEVALRAGSLPLGLSVLGAHLRGRKNLKDWMDMMPTLRTKLNGKIESTLRFSYEGLNDENDEELFRHISCIFNGEKVEDMKQLLDGVLHVDAGLQILIDKSLVHVRKHTMYTENKEKDTIEMHLLLQEMGKKIVKTQSKKPGKREFLVDAKDICNVLKDNTGTENVLGITLDTDENDEHHIHESAFTRMRGLLYLKFHAKQNKNVIWHLPEGFDYLPSTLRLLCWKQYPLSHMPSKFSPEYLVKLQMQESKLENLWAGIPPLANLKDLDLKSSKSLKSIPDLSKAISLVTIDLSDCSSLRELPSSIQHLNKLEQLIMSGCSSLETLPPAINLQSLHRLDLKGCSSLRSFPDISTNIQELILCETGIDKFPTNLRLEKLTLLSINDIKSATFWEIEQPLSHVINMASTLKMLTLSDIPSLVELPSSIQNLQLFYLQLKNCINLETLPTDINLESLGGLDLSGCSRLRSFPNISNNIKYLYLSNTSIEEVPWWIEKFYRLTNLHMNGCHKLRSVSLHISKMPDLYTAEFSNCEALIEVNLNGGPNEVATDDIYSILLQALSSLPDNFLQALSSLPYNYIGEANVDFFNCLKLDQENLIQKQADFCKVMMLSGEEVPSYFTHRTTGNSMVVPLLYDISPSQQLLNFKVCVVVDCQTIPETHDLFRIQLACRLIDRQGNSFITANIPMFVRNLKWGSQLVLFEYSFPLKDQIAPLAETNYDNSPVVGIIHIGSSQYFHGFEQESEDMGVGGEPPRHEVQYKLNGWGIREPPPPEVASSSRGLVTRASELGTM